MWIEYKLIDRTSTEDSAHTHIINCDNIWSFELDNISFLITFTDKVRLKYIFNTKSECELVHKAFKNALKGNNTFMQNLGHVELIKE